MVSKETRDARKKQTAEFFTPPILVNKMLDKFNPDSWQEEKTFCDPSAGNGNFLVEVYRRKVEVYKHSPIKALTTIYGVELMPDNVQEMKDRLLEMAISYGVNKNIAMMILNKNIVCHDALTYDFTFS